MELDVRVGMVVDRELPVSTRAVVTDHMKKNELQEEDGQDNHSSVDM
jgi:hypothetical protein